MKTKWITPRTEIETFVPDEYIAVCWGVSCDVDNANIYEQTHYASRGETWWERGCSHALDHCGNSDNQWIYDRDNNGIPEGMEERNTDGLGTLPCTIDGDITSIRPGMYIYWTTSAGNRTWHHRGWVSETKPGRPNAS